MDDQAEDLGRFARQYTPRVVTFLQDLVRIPSVNGQDPEAAVAQRIAQEQVGRPAPVRAHGNVAERSLRLRGDHPAHDDHPARLAEDEEEDWDWEKEED